jgi:hypothetical protein
MRRSLMEPSSAMPSLAKSIASATGWPWKLPPETTVPPPVASASGSASEPSGKTRGLSVALLSSMVSTARVYWSASSVAPWTWGTQRME